MADFLLLMHDDLDVGAIDGEWEAYISGLSAAGVFRGGSSIGAGEAFRRGGPPVEVSGSLSGFIRIEAPDLDAARSLLKGNPVYEAGGTVEIRALVED